MVVNRRFIQENREREKRDRNERLLNEVKEWAKEAALAAITRQTATFTELSKTKLKYKYSIATSEYIMQVVNDSFKNLSPRVNKVVKELKKAIPITEETFKGKKMTPEYFDTSLVIEQEGKISDAVKELLKALASTNY